MPEYNLAEIQRIAGVLGTKAGHLGQVGDHIPKADDTQAFGALEASGPIATDAQAKLSGYNSEFAAGEKLLRECSDALHKAAEMLQAQEAETVESLTPTNKQV